MGRVGRAIGSSALNIAVAVAGAVLAYLFTVWVSLLLSQSAINLRPATCLSTHCFCEADMGGFPRQLVNPFSSLAFVALGFWVIFVVRKPGSNSRERKLWPWVAVIMVLIGASSFYYHAPLSFLGQFLDIFSMFLFALLVVTGGSRIQDLRQVVLGRAVPKE